MGIKGGDIFDQVVDLDRLGYWCLLDHVKNELGQKGNVKVYFQNLNKNKLRFRESLQLVYSDVVSPLPVTIGGSRYFVKFVDDRSRLTWLFPMKDKSNVFAWFKAWLAIVENQHGKKLKVLRSD